jgi:hypothetical protein
LFEHGAVIGLCHRAVPYGLTSISAIMGVPGR